MRRFLIIIATILLMSTKWSRAAISFDSSTISASEGATTTSYSWTHTVGSGTNAVLIVGTANYTAFNVTGVTYNSVSMTQISSNSRTKAYLALWYLKNPTVGSHSVTVSQSADYAFGESNSFFGVDQAVVFDSSTYAYELATSATSGSISITPQNSNDWLVDFFYSPNNLENYESATWTKTQYLADSVNGQTAGTSYKGPVSSAQTNTWVWFEGLESGYPWADSAVSLKPAVNAGGQKSKKLMLLME